MKQSDKEWLGRKIHSEAEVERGLERWELEKSETLEGPDRDLHIAAAHSHAFIATALDRLAERIETS